MKASRFVISAAMVLAVLATQAAAMPSAWYSFNGNKKTIPQNAWVHDQNGNWVVSFHDNNPGSYQISGNIQITADPQILYGISTSNITSNTAMFAFGLTDTFAGPINRPNQVYASMATAVTDGTGNGLKLLATNGSKIQSTLLDLTNASVDVGNSFSVAPGLPGETYSGGFDSKGPKAGPVGSWGGLTTNLSYSLTGKGDVATLTGSSIVTVQPIPEPASALLLLPGLIAVAASRRRRS